MIRFRAPSPAPPTVLRSTAGLSGVIVPYSPVLKLAAAWLGASADALAAGGALAAVVGAALGALAAGVAAGVAVPPPQAAATRAAAAARVRMGLRMGDLLLRIRVAGYASAISWVCCRFQVRRTARPCWARTSVEVVARFCCVTTSSPPASRTT